MGAAHGCTEVVFPAQQPTMNSTLKPTTITTKKKKKNRLVLQQQRIVLILVFIIVIIVQRYTYKSFVIISHHRHEQEEEEIQEQHVRLQRQGQEQYSLLPSLGGRRHQKQEQNLLSNWYCSWNSTIAIAAATTSSSNQKSLSSSSLSSSLLSSSYNSCCSCYDLFSKYNIQKYQHWILLGDSNMYLLYKHLITSLNETTAATTTSAAAAADKTDTSSTTATTTTRSSSSKFFQNTNSYYALNIVKEESHNNTNRCVKDISKLTKYFENYIDGPPKQWIKPNYTYGEGPAAQHYLDYNPSKPFLCHNLPSPYQKVQFNIYNNKNKNHDNNDNERDLFDKTSYPPVAFAATTTNSKKMKPNITTTTTKTIEFIVSAFARDVEVPSLTTKTTQETIALYLQRSYSTTTPAAASSTAGKPAAVAVITTTTTSGTIGSDGGAPSSTLSSAVHNTYHNDKNLVCIVNSGLHDMYIPAPKSNKNMSITKLHYIRNVKWYIYDLLLGTARCNLVVWITISATMDLKKYKQRNRRVYGWNQAIISMIQEQRQQQEQQQLRNNEKDGVVLVLDVYDESYGTKHVDNAHMIDEYYQKLNIYLLEPFLLLDGDVR